MIVLFALVFVVMSHFASADMDIFYPGAASSIAPVPAGAAVDYEYIVDDTYSSGASVHRVIQLLDAGFTPLSTLVDETENGFQYGFGSIDTTGFAPGTYFIFGTATDSYNSYTDYVSFDVLSSNNAPYFDSLDSYYSYPINWANVNVVDLANFGADADGDPLTYSISASTNPSVATCNLVGTVLNCDLNSVGTTTVDVTVSDAYDSTTQTLTIEVTPNTAPVFDSSMPSSYTFPLLPSVVDVVDLANYASDAENDPITYYVDTSSTDTSVISSCNIVSGSTLQCTWSGLGTTTVDVIAYDGVLSTTQTLSITVTPVGNTAPVFVNMTQFYQYPVSQASATVVDLANFAYDAQADPLTFSMTPSTDASIADCSLTGSVVTCNFPGNLGIASVDVTVSDGSLSTTVTLYVNVYDYVGNNTAPYFVNMSQFYMYDIAMGGATIDINHGFDAEGNPLSYYLDTGFTDPAVLSCNLVGTDVDCTFNGLGLTTFDAIVSDGVLSTVQEIHVLVYDSTANNSMPVFNNLTLSYTYPLALGNTDVVDLANHGFDADNDPLMYFIDTGFTSSAVLDASLVASSVVHTDFNGLGTTPVRVIVYDGQWASDAELSIEVTDSNVTGPVAVIDAPATVCAGEEFTVDGSASYTISGASITDYTWVITDSFGTPLVTSTGAQAQYTITTPGNYYVSLQVADSQGNSAFSVQPLDVLANCGGNNLAFGTESGLKIDALDVYGFDYEKAYVDGDLTITATVENVADVDFHNIRMIYTLPEFGLRFKTSAFSLAPGERKAVQIYGFVPDYVEEDTYYPYIEFSDDEFRRVKAGYLEVYEQ